MKLATLIEMLLEKKNMDILWKIIKNKSKVTLSTSPNLVYVRQQYLQLKERLWKRDYCIPSEQKYYEVGWSILKSLFQNLLIHAIGWLNNGPVNATWKVSKYGVFSGLRISPYWVRLRENTNQKKLRIGTLFTQCKRYERSHFCKFSSIFFKL